MKIIKSIFYFFLIFNFEAKLFAEKSDNDSARNNHNWVINIFGAPDFNYRLVYHKPGNNGPMQNAQRSYTTSDQIGKLGWHLGFSVSRKIIPHLYFQTGLIIDKKGYDSKNFYDTITSGRFSTTYTQIDNIGFNYFFIGIPIFISYEKKISEYWTIGITTGVTGNFSEHGKEFRFGRLEGEIEFSKEKFWNWPLIAYGKIDFFYEYKANRAVSISPTFSSCIQSMNDYYTKDWRYNNLHLYSAGIEVGLHCYLGKKK